MFALVMALCLLAHCNALFISEDVCAGTENKPTHTTLYTYGDTVRISLKLQGCQIMDLYRVDGTFSSPSTVDILQKALSDRILIPPKYLTGFGAAVYSSNSTGSTVTGPEVSFEVGMPLARAKAHICQVLARPTILPDGFPCSLAGEKSSHSAAMRGCSMQDVSTSVRGLWSCVKSLVHWQTKPKPSSVAGGIIATTPLTYSSSVDYMKRAADAQLRANIVPTLQTTDAEIAEDKPLFSSSAAADPAPLPQTGTNPRVVEIEIAEDEPTLSPSASANPSSFSTDVKLPSGQYVHPANDFPSPRRPLPSTWRADDSDMIVQPRMHEMPLQIETVQASEEVTLDVEVVGSIRSARGAAADGELANLVNPTNAAVGPELAGTVSGDLVQTTFELARGSGDPDALPITSLQNQASSTGGDVQASGSSSEVTTSDTIDLTVVCTNQLEGHMHEQRFRTLLNVFLFLAVFTVGLLTGLLISYDGWLMRGRRAIEREALRHHRRRAASSAASSAAHYGEDAFPWTPRKHDSGALSANLLSAHTTPSTLTTRSSTPDSVDSDDADDAADEYVLTMPSRR